MKLIISNIALAVAYFFAAKLGLLLAVPTSGIAAAIWPAAGLATAGVIIGGPRLFPGVFLGVMFFQASLFLQETGNKDIILSCLMAIVASLGRVIQVWIVIRLIRPIMAQDQALLRELSIAKFFLISGPVSCVFSATAGIFTLWYLNILNPVDLPLAWGTWWIGDTIGVLIFCPIFLCFFGRPRYPWRKRIYSVAIPLCVLILVILVVFKISYQQELKYIEGEFEKNALRFKSELVNSFDIHMWSAEDLKAHLNHPGLMPPEQFSRYIDHKLTRHPEIKALQWIPLIHHEERQAFEARVGSVIKIRNDNGEMVPSPDKANYFPIEFLEPLKGNENALSYDVQSNSKTAATIEKACVSGEMTVTGPITLVQEAKAQVAIIFHAPLYRLDEQGHPHSTCDQLRGFAASVFRLENEILNIHKKLDDSSLFVSLRNESGLLYSDTADPDAQAKLSSQSIFKRSYILPVANQQWELSFYPVPEFVSIHSTHSMFLIIIGGLFFSAMVGVGLMMLTGRNFLTQEKIDQRTAELNEEVKQRKDVAALLEVENKSLEMIAQEFSTHEILNSITSDINKIMPDAHASILLMSADGLHLEQGASPSLPDDFKASLNGLEIGEKVGSCGTAAFLNKQVIVSDIASDPLWDNHRDIAARNNIKASWSAPITVSGKKVLGTFTLYFNTPKEPDSGSIDLVRRMANITAIAILRKQSEEQLIFNASHDALTELVNRREFEKRATRMIDSVKKHKHQHALCFLDLDQFKVVNDSCGHTAGDQMLREISMVLQQVVRKRDTLARMGGDEFSVLMEHCSLENAQRLAHELHSVIQEYVFAWEDQSFRVGVCIGLVAITEEVPNLTELLKEADAACYMAKNSGRNRIHTYHPEDAEISRRQGEMKWVSRVNQALVDNRFCLYAQQILPLSGDSEEHYELLIRMIDEDQKIIPPGAFLPAAEIYNLITKIDLWVIENAFSLLVSHAEFLNRINFVSINLSGDSLANQGILKFIIGQLDATGIDGRKICFEITETAAISNMAVAKKLISELKLKGCRFALDDFGSGLSSFGYLKNLSVDYLKIDGIFVKDILDDPIDHAMVKSINEIGHVMGMQTIAEFVETDEIKVKLKEIGVDYAQGYGVQKPEPLEQLMSKSRAIA